MVFRTTNSQWKYNTEKASIDFQSLKATVEFMEQAPSTSTRVENGNMFPLLSFDHINHKYHSLQKFVDNMKDHAVGKKLDEIEPLDLGYYDLYCIYCGAMTYYHEQSFPVYKFSPGLRLNREHPLHYSKCCQRGLVSVLPTISITDTFKGLREELKKYDGKQKGYLSPVYRSLRRVLNQHFSAVDLLNDFKRVSDNPDLTNGSPIIIERPKPFKHGGIAGDLRMSQNATVFKMRDLVKDISQFPMDVIKNVILTNVKFTNANILELLENDVRTVEDGLKAKILPLNIKNLQNCYYGCTVCRTKPKDASAKFCTKVGNRQCSGKLDFLFLLKVYAIADGEMLNVTMFHSQAIAFFKIRGFNQLKELYEDPEKHESFINQINHVCSKFYDVKLKIRKVPNGNDINMYYTDVVLTQFQRSSNFKPIPDLGGDERVDNDSSDANSDPGDGDEEEFD
ncbi:hypothetical protein WICPIJ_009737 [Wickerhamomyces pijperi]|uniref:Uncharacterized protein n=1 Tax=Wickerhamomyces pijperi TaxID=599730 RepID=A0A9P8PLG5_WICPI|nr:hypothetical protein WICPIJ_009737 [Wickerhamomyces pijperi]